MANTYKLIATIVISSIIAMVIAMIVAEALNYLRHQQSVRLGANLEPDKPLSD
jgi:phosphate/sulfate permease